MLDNRLGDTFKRVTAHIKKKARLDRSTRGGQNTKTLGKKERKKKTEKQEAEHSPVGFVMFSVHKTSL